MSKIIVFAFPVFLAAMAFELWWDRRAVRAGRVPQSRYAFSDTLNSLTLGLLSQISGVPGKLIGLAAYAGVYQSVALFPKAQVWDHWYGWLIALVFYDFCYYWLHRAGHTVALFWAAHVVHHQSQQYNLSTALRQTSSGGLLGWIFYIPMALLGVPPLLFGIVALVDLLYQFWVHTEYVGKLGWFDRVFCSPSNHRVHHAVNDDYVDRNYGGILIVWDRLFGTFQEEHDICVYGTRAPLNSWDPLWANVQIYAGLCANAWAFSRWTDKVRVWLKPPGWQPDEALPKPTFDLRAVEQYRPPLSPDQRRLAMAQFAILMAASTVFLWHADAMVLTQAVLYGTLLCAAAWGTGGYLQTRLSGLSVMLVYAACVAGVVAIQHLPI